MTRSQLGLIERLGLDDLQPRGMNLIGIRRKHILRLRAQRRVVAQPQHRQTVDGLAGELGRASQQRLDDAGGDDRLARTRHRGQREGCATGMPFGARGLICLDTRGDGIQNLARRLDLEWEQFQSHAGSPFW